jgi:AmmeMemoRadiSam system protein A
MSRDPPAFLPLTAAERYELLWLARQSIYAALHGTTPPESRAFTPALSAPGAAFVSLHYQHRLRGCIGTLTAERPLHRAVAQMALSAAFDDPRFSPLAKSELPGVVIEISRLSPLVPALPEEICPGRHGVCVMQGDQRGVFLPQVALEYHWDRETLLRELCRKALLPPEAWRHPGATLMLFEAEVFAEEAAEC